MDAPKQQNPAKNAGNSKNFVNSKYIRKKRPTRKTDRKCSSIYVSRESNIKAFIHKCDKLIGNNVQEITIYCMGAAIHKGLVLGLKLCEKHVGFQNSVNTSTIELVDDLEPVTDDMDYESVKRNNSAVRITVFRRV